MGTPQQEGDTALWPTKHRSKCGKQEHSAELTLFEAKLGVRRGKHSKAPVQESQQGEAAHAARMWGRAQTSCSGKQQNRQWWLWKEEGREIPSYRHRAGKAVSCESRRGLDRMSRERVQTKLPPTEKVGEHENVVLIRWGLAYTHRSEQLA